MTTAKLKRHTLTLHANAFPFVIRWALQLPENAFNLGHWDYVLERIVPVHVVEGHIAEKQRQSDANFDARLAKLRSKHLSASEHWRYWSFNATPWSKQVLVRFNGFGSEDEKAKGSWRDREALPRLKNT